VRLSAPCCKHFVHSSTGDALKLWGRTNVREMIGEAVPPFFTRKHGRILVQLLTGMAPQVALDRGGTAFQVNSSPPRFRRSRPGTPCQGQGAPRDGMVGVKVGRAGNRARALRRWTGRILRVEVEGWVDPELPVSAADALGQVARAVASGFPRRAASPGPRGPPLLIMAAMPGECRSGRCG